MTNELHLRHCFARNDVFLRIIEKIGLICFIIFFLNFNVGFPAQRIISLAPNLTEMLFAIGAGKNIVGVSVDSDYPAAAKGIPIVANAGQLNIEAIIASKPDLIVAWQGGNPQAQLDELERFHIPVYTFQFTKISDITAAMLKLGQLTDHVAQAAKQVQKFNEKLSEIKKSQIHSAQIKVLYLLWQTPLITVGKNTLINQAITLCGGENIFADLIATAPTVSLASVLQHDPAVIFSGFKNANWKNYWRQWPQIAAVQSHRLYFINPDLMQRPGPRFVLGVQEMCRFLLHSRKKSLKSFQ